MPEKQYKFQDASTLVKLALKLDYFQPGEDGSVPIPALWKKGKGPLTLVVGENASGKSFFRRVIGAICGKASERTEYMPISMEGRRNVAYNPHLVFVYGDEASNATGVNSAYTVTTGIRTSQGRDNRHVIFWDEPDLGLSDSWAAGMGQKFAAFAKEPTEHLVAAFIVTHNRIMVRELLDTEPNYLHLGVEPEKAPQSLLEWVQRPIKARDIDNLAGESHERFKAIQKILNRLKSS